jgi:hypothetical protein
MVLNACWAVSAQRAFFMPIFSRLRALLRLHSFRRGYAPADIRPVAIVVDLKPTVHDLKFQGGVL